MEFRRVLFRSRNSRRVLASEEIRSLPSVLHPDPIRIRLASSPALPNARRAHPLRVESLLARRGRSSGVWRRWQWQDLRQLCASRLTHALPLRHVPRCWHIRELRDTRASSSTMSIAALLVKYRVFRSALLAADLLARSPIASSQQIARHRLDHPDPTRSSTLGRACSDHVSRERASLETPAGFLPRSRESGCRDRWWAHRAAERRQAAASTERSRRAPALHRRVVRLAG